MSAKQDYPGSVGNPEGERALAEIALLRSDVSSLLAKLDMSDDQIRTTLGYDYALRKAGLDVVPTDIAKLGRTVERKAARGSWIAEYIYAEAGVERDVTDYRIRRSRVLPTIGGWLTGRSRPMSAVTIRRTITVHPDRILSDRLLRHELAHVRQWDAHPWTFPFRYVWAHLRHGYQHNPYEVEARKAERT